MTLVQIKRGISLLKRSSNSGKQPAGDCYWELRKKKKKKKKKKDDGD